MMKSGWLRSVRVFVLDGARYSHPELGPEDYLAVKEPKGSIGAPVIMEALPECRMLLLIRDPRDVVSSALDGAKGGGWLDEWRGDGASERGGLADRKPDAFFRNDAHRYLRSAGNAARAYDSHAGPKVMVRYEDLLGDAPAHLKRIYRELGIPADGAALVRSAEKHSWKSIPLLEEHPELRKR